MIRRGAEYSHEDSDTQSRPSTLFPGKRALKKCSYVRPLESYHLLVRCEYEADIYASN